MRKRKFCTRRVRLKGRTLRPLLALLALLALLILPLAKSLSEEPLYSPFLSSSPGSIMVTIIISWFYMEVKLLLSFHFQPSFIPSWFNFLVFWVITPADFHSSVPRLR